MRRQQGFSIVEIIIVIVIIFIVTGTAIPVYISQKPRIRLNGATSQIVGDLMWARMRAVCQNNEYKIFLLDNHRYLILDDDDSQGDIDDGEITIIKDIQDKYNDITLTSTADPIFHPRGTASPATITITGPAGTKAISIAITGRVKVN